MLTPSASAASVFESASRGTVAAGDQIPCARRSRERLVVVGEVIVVPPEGALDQLANQVGFPRTGTAGDQ